MIPLSLIAVWFAGCIKNNSEGILIQDYSGWTVKIDGHWLTGKFTAHPMKRQQPLFSTSGFISTIFLLVGLGLALWRTGGLAFSPGRLSERAPASLKLEGFQSHAGFEAQCERCHDPLHTTQDVLCLSCHTEVADQLQTGRGTHSQVEAVRQCAACHSDHRGRDFDAVQSAFSHFDHTRTVFSLLRHQVNYDTRPMACTACHTRQGFTRQGTFAVAPGECQACHSTRDQAFAAQHAAEFGANCLDCHDGRDRMVGFDHSQTSFPLKDKHASLACASCHGLEAVQSHPSVGQPSQDRSMTIGEPVAGASAGLSLNLESFQQTPQACEGCHAEPHSHQGLFSPDCAQCHAPAGWSPARLDGQPFNHETSTSFSLARHAQTAQGQALVCVDCHQADLKNFDLQFCVRCHSQGEEGAVFMSRHLDEFGPACLDCHDGVDRLSNFDHANFFPLGGKHAGLACEQCHANKTFRDTPSACVQCHAEPAIHAGFFGLQCQYCHSDQAWTPAGLTLHPFTVDHGGNGPVICATCHPGPYTQYTCYGCHDHTRPGIEESHNRVGVAAGALPQCAQCHPTGTEADHPRAELPDLGAAQPGGAQQP